jgi:hypothetical protein
MSAFCRRRKMTYEEIKIIENYIIAAAIPQSAGKI